MSPEERELWVSTCDAVLRSNFNGAVGGIVDAAIQAANKVVEAYRTANTTWITADGSWAPKPGEMIEVDKHGIPTPPKGRS